LVNDVNFILFVHMFFIDKQIEKKNVLLH